MELREFIRETLVEIAQGVSDAQFEASHLIAITPGTINGESNEEITDIEFDIALTTSTENTSSSEKSLTSGKLKVVGVEVSAGGGMKSEEDATELSEKISRIKFKVPVKLSAWFRNDDQILPELKLKKEAYERRRKSADETRIPTASDFIAKR